MSMLVICFERNLIQHSHRCHGLVSWLGHRIHFKWFVIIIPQWGANKAPLSWDLEGVNIWATCHIQMKIIDISEKSFTDQFNLENWTLETKCLQFDCDFRQMTIFALTFYLASWVWCLYKILTLIQCLLS